MNQVSLCQVKRSCCGSRIPISPTKVEIDGGTDYHSKDVNMHKFWFCCSINITDMQRCNRHDFSKDVLQCLVLGCGRALPFSVFVRRQIRLMVGSQIGLSVYHSQSYHLQVI